MSGTNKNKRKTLNHTSFVNLKEKQTERYETVV
jgi:hypothetical protein